MTTPETKCGLGNTVYTVDIVGRPCCQLRGSCQWHFEDERYQTRAEAEHNKNELKYRVWSVSDEKYITNVALLPSGEIFYISDNFDGSVELWEPGPPVGVERCTGRHDVAGELIYEDDVVVVPEGNELVEYVIKWRNSMWCLYHWPHDYKPLDDFDYRQCRIVGNIHDKEKNEQKENVQ